MSDNRVRNEAWRRDPVALVIRWQRLPRLRIEDLHDEVQDGKCARHTLMNRLNPNGRLVIPDEIEKTLKKAFMKYLGH